MLLFKAQKEVVIKASPEKDFAIVSDIARHNLLAGSGEVLKIRRLTEGSVGIGTKFEADEDIKVGPSRMKFVATSEIVSYNPPTEFSWTSSPPANMSPKMRRIQWWFKIQPQQESVRLTHEVEVEAMSAALTTAFRLPYRMMRGGTIKKGMERTLANIKKAAET
ncbi:MAG: hypothetical protein FJ320_01580 [SAR202 cluster bacterium]|nr:hypothetical protein [SAR202 cluster bacterium]